MVEGISRTLHCRGVPVHLLAAVLHGRADIYEVQYQHVKVRLSAIVFYFGSMFLVSLVFGLICGTVGFMASYKFVRLIYGLIKHD